MNLDDRGLSKQWHWVLEKPRHFAHTAASPTITSIAWHPTGRFLAVATTLQHIHIVDTKRKTEISSMAIVHAIRGKKKGACRKSYVYTMVWDPSGQYIAFDRNSHLYIADTKTGRVKHILKEAGYGLRIYWHREYPYLIVENTEGVLFWNTRLRKVEKQYDFGMCRLNSSLSVGEHAASFKAQDTYQMVALSDPSKILYEFPVSTQVEMHPSHNISNRSQMHPTHNIFVKYDNNTHVNTPGYVTIFSALNQFKTGFRCSIPTSAILRWSSTGKYLALNSWYFVVTVFK